jgi:DNA-binding PadR family transcriptional regulator
MSETTLRPQDQLPLTSTVFHILLALADGERHGYSIREEVARITEERIQMGPGTLYGTIKRMVEAHLIEETDERPDPEMDDERRRYYHLTAFGERVAQAEVKRLSMLLNVARSKRLIGDASS